MSIATGLRQPAGFNYVGEGWSVWSLVFSAGFFLVFSPTGCFGSLLRLGVFVPVFLLLLFALLFIGGSRLGFEWLFCQLGGLQQCFCHAARTVRGVLPSIAIIGECCYGICICIVPFAG